MFSRCVINTNSGITIEKTIILILISKLKNRNKKISENGKTNDAKIELRDTQPDNNNVKKKINKQLMNEKGVIAIIKPVNVAIPLPPLNLEKIEKVCPITALDPAII